jgi:polynucleotide 5'-kinase involved in rRNA processing
MKAFAAYFREARRLELDLDQLTVQRSLPFTGEPVIIEGALYAERTAEGVVAVAEDALPGGEVAKRLRPGFERNLLCGVAEECNRGVGLALIQSIDFHRRTVLLMSPVPVEKVGCCSLATSMSPSTGVSSDRSDENDLDAVAACRSGEGQALSASQLTIRSGRSSRLA